MRFQRYLPALFLLITLCHPVSGPAAEEDGAKKKNEAPSPDGRFAFRYKGESDDQSYVLIDRKSGKVLQRVAKADPDIGPSARFQMEVLWKPDSERFALTGTFWKRGSEVLVFVRDGAAFRQVKLPELLAEIPEKVMAGKEYPHVVELNSQSAKRWLKDGSLEVEIETAQDGNGSTIQANRTVILGFGKDGTAKILKSTTKYTKPDEASSEPAPKLNPVPCTTRIIAGHDEGSADGPGDRAQFANPWGVAADSAGNIYVADTANGLLRRIKADGTVETVAGVAGQSASTDGTGKEARFSAPCAVAIGPDGSIYVAEVTGALRKVTPEGVVTTVVKDLGSQLNPRGLAVDRAGIIYVSDYHDFVVRKIDPDGKMTVVAGQRGKSGNVNGPAKNAQFDFPCGVAAAAADGSLYVTDRCVIRKIDAHGVVTTFAGAPNTVNQTDDGRGAAARFSNLTAITIDAQGTLYIIDMGTLRQVSPSGVVRTLRTANKEPLPLKDPVALAIDPQGRIVVANRGANSVALVELVR